MEISRRPEQPARPEGPLGDPKQVGDRLVSGPVEALRPAVDLPSLDLETPIQRALRVLSESLPEGVWKNWGDVNFVPYGGLQVKREGSTMELLRLDTSEDANLGESFLKDKGTVTLEDLICVDPDGKAVFTPDALSYLQHWRTALPVCDVNGLSDEDLQGLLYAALAGASHAGIMENEREWSPKGMLKVYTIAHPLGEVERLDEAVPVKLMSTAQALKATRLQDWVDDQVRDELAYMGLAEVEAADRYPESVPTPEALLCPYGREVNGLRLLRDSYANKPVAYVHEVAASLGGPEEAYLLKAGYRTTVRTVEGQEGCRVFEKQVDLDLPATLKREAEDKLADGMEAMRPILERLAGVWINDGEFSLTPEEMVSIAQLMDGIPAFWETNNRHQALLEDVLVERWAFLPDALRRNFSDRDRKELADILGDAMEPLWQFSSLQALNNDSGGVVMVRPKGELPPLVVGGEPYFILPDVDYDSHPIGFHQLPTKDLVTLATQLIPSKVLSMDPAVEVVPGFPPRIMKTLRQRVGLEPDDVSRDAELSEMSPEDALCEMCAWEFGTPNWASTVLGWAKDCGYLVAVKPSTPEVEAPAVIDRERLSLDEIVAIQNLRAAIEALPPTLTLPSSKLEVWKNRGSRAEAKGFDTVASITVS